ncbi:MAG: hypothetical protein H7289_10055 [Mucilaginibacter sp.]|nr:hypothetical protein [Mucilaginibacter sp.]
MPTKTFNSNALKTILWLGLVTGTLDAAWAILFNLNLGPEVIFSYIASAIFGKAAFAGGPEMPIAGVIFHYLIAYLFTTAFYVWFPTFLAGFKNKYVVAIVYGGFAWMVMNLAVIPLSKIGTFPAHPIPIIKGVLALIICIGLPVVLVADKKNK